LPSDYTRYHEEEDMVTSYMTDRRIEILAVVEGCDATTGGIVQARHSFIVPEIMWHKGFGQCVFEDSDGSAVVDFDKFHTLVDVPVDTAYAGHIQSHN
jgi:hypothetical protein